MQVQANNQNQNQQQQTNNNRKKILYLICILLFFSFSTRINRSNVKSFQNVRKKMQNSETLILQEMLELYVLEQTYFGHWKAQSQHPSKYLKSSQGKYLINVYRQYNTMNFSLYVQIFDGYYVDKGVVSFTLNFHRQMFTSHRQNNTLNYGYNKNTSFNTTYNRRQMLIYPETGDLQFSDINFRFVYLNREFQTQMDLQIIENQTVQNSIKMKQFGKQNSTLNLIIFSVVLMVVSILPFMTLIQIIRNVYELRDNPRGYSLLTIGCTCMWDATLCILSFMYAFNDQESLMLFIVQAFLFCLLFTNLQPRFMIFIFQHNNNNNNIREIICKFNLFHYGTLLLIYPILLFTNLNWAFYIGLSCILFPQIYTNGVNGYRPDLTSGYYLKYILSRYLLIIYLKCNPYNIFYLEPDYLLVAICTLLVSLQFALLYVQKKYGAKKILPGFLLEPVFNYKFQDETNNEDLSPEMNQCAICLMPYGTIPAQIPNEIELQPNFKLMKTPCNHVYHSRCLVSWMRVKMQCPQCRQALPPFQ